MLPQSIVPIPDVQLNNVELSSFHSAAARRSGRRLCSQVRVPQLLEGLCELLLLLVAEVCAQLLGTLLQRLHATEQQSVARAHMLTWLLTNDAAADHSAHPTYLRQHH